MIRFDATGYKRKLEKLIHKKVSEDFEKVAKDMITYFYESYSPSKYKRTYNYKYGTIIKKMRKQHQGGIYVDNSGMTDYYSNPERSLMSKDYWGKDAHVSAIADFVFDLIWNQGVRGLPSGNAHGWVNAFYMKTYYPIDEFGIEGKSPDEVLGKLCDVWYTVRENTVNQIAEDIFDEFLK